MLLGLDTGFFISHHHQHPRARMIWQEYSAGAHTCVVSTLSFNELFTYFIKRNLLDLADEWLYQTRNAERLLLVEVSAEIAAHSARYRLGLGMSTVDSILLTTFLEQGCEMALTTDSDFQIVAHHKLLPVEILTP
jgi:predicted nucleic acid-binding protein